jgi:hypothetical protein
MGTKLVKLFPYKLKQKWAEVEASDPMDIGLRAGIQP